MLDFPAEATSLEDMAWWVEQPIKQKRGRGRPRIHPKKYPLSQEYKDQKNAIIEERALRIIESYKSGQTLLQVGATHGITRERVRQILKKHGLSRMDGGQSIRIFLATPDRVLAEKKERERRDKFKFRVWRLSVDEWEKIRAEFGYKPFRAYTRQRQTARSRGIEWDFDFKTWWNLWQESGHWHERGPGPGYCMARLGDSGPYSKNNVYICTVGQNFSDSYTSKPYHTRKRKHLISAFTTHCRNGHLRTTENTYVYKGSKNCRLCLKVSYRKYRMKKRSKRAKACRTAA